MGVVDALGVGIAVVLGAWVLGREVARAWNRSDEPPESYAGPLTFLKRIAAVTVFSCVTYATVRFDPGGAVGSEPIVGAAVNGGYLVAVTGLASVALATVLEPFAREIEHDEYRLPSRLRHRHLAAWVAVLVGVALVLALALEPGVPVDLAVVPPVAVFLGLGVYWPVTMPNRISNGGPDQYLCRAPTDDERERIEGCFERFGRTPGRILVSPEGGPLGVVATGRGTARTLTVTRPFLDRVDDDTLGVALAQADERGRRRYLAWNAWLITVAVLLVLAIVYTLAGVLPKSPATMALWLGGFALVFVPLWGMKRATIAGDRLAVEQFGAETVRESYERVGDELSTVKNDLVGSKWFERVVSVLPLEPPMPYRIRRIGSRRDDDQPR